MDSCRYLQFPIEVSQDGEVRLDIVEKRAFELGGGTRFEVLVERSGDEVRQRFARLSVADHILDCRH